MEILAGGMIDTRSSGTDLAYRYDVAARFAIMTHGMQVLLVFEPDDIAPDKQETTCESQWQ